MNIIEITILETIYTTPHCYYTKQCINFKMTQNLKILNCFISYLFIITQFILNLNIILKEGMLDKNSTFNFIFQNGLLKKC